MFWLQEFMSTLPRVDEARRQTAMTRTDWLAYTAIILVTALVVAVSFFDLRERRIPNFLVFPAALLGLIINSLAGWHGLLYGLKGLGLGFLLLLIPYIVGGMKAGDVKFLAAIGAFVGASEIIRVFLATLLCYPLLAAIPVIRERKLRITLLRFARLSCGLLGVIVPAFKLYALRLAAKDDPQIASVTTPFGVAIAVGTLIALLTKFLR